MPDGIANELTLLASLDTINLRCMIGMICMIYMICMIFMIGMTFMSCMNCVICMILYLFRTPYACRDRQRVD